MNRDARIEVEDALSRYRERASEDAAAFGRAPSITTTEGPAAPLAVQTAEGSEQPWLPSSLRDYIIMALRENPEIKAAEEMARAEAARVPQATALPDPMLMTRTLPEPVRTAEGDNYFSLGVQQSFPIPAKLDRAGRMALQEARMAIEELQRQRLNVIADVKRTYFRIYIVDRTIEVDLTNQDLLRGLIDAARAQVASGRRRQDDVLRAQVELSNLESQLVELRQERRTMVAMLNRVLNRPPGTDVPTLEDYDARTAELRLEALFAGAAERNPELQRFKQQLERDRHGVELAKLAYWPDFTLGFEWMYMRPREAWVPPPNPQTGMVPAVNRMSEEGSDNWAITLS
ncbi:MAG: TolC family protein, partial [bacterium]